MTDIVDRLRDAYPTWGTMREAADMIEKLRKDCEYWSVDHDKICERLNEEIKTVARVWDALGISSFEQAKGNAIWEIVSRHKSGLESIAKNGCCDNCQEAKTVAIAALTGPDLPGQKCNHWPGQPRCEVCGMGIAQDGNCPAPIVPSEKAPSPDPRVLIEAKALGQFVHAEQYENLRFIAKNLQDRAENADAEILRLRELLFGREIRSSPSALPSQTRGSPHD